MAKEIWAGLSREKFGGDAEWTLLFFYDISADPILDANSNQVAPMAGNAVPTGITLDAPYQAGVDAGDAIFEVVSYTQSLGEGLADFIDRMKLAHAARETFYVEWVRDQWARVGQTVNV